MRLLWNIPFYIKGKGWNPAGSLKVGGLLHNGTTVVVEEVDSRVRLVWVFNFSVANVHNYGGDGVLVFFWNKTIVFQGNKVYSVTRFS